MVTENEYGFSLSIDRSGGVDQWLGDGAQLNHYQDWIRVKGRPEIGSSFSVTHDFNEGDFDRLPEDYQFSLQPGDTKTIYNKEKHGAYDGVKFDLVIKYIGPAPAFQEPENGNGPDPQARPVLFPRLRAFIDNFRGRQL